MQLDLIFDLNYLTKAQHNLIFPNLGWTQVGLQLGSQG